MKRAKRLMVVLLATLVMLTGAFSVVYAAVDHSSSHTVTANHNGATLQYKCNQGGTSSNRCEYYYGSAGYQHSVVLNCDSTFDSGSTKTTYDGEPHGVVVTGLDGHGSIVSQIGDISYSGDDYDLPVAPTDAGSYSATVTIRLSGSGTYAGDYVLTRNFTIEKREITPEWSGDTFTYNGQEQVPELTFTSGGTAFDLPADVYEVTYTKASDTSASVASPTDADSYTAKVTLLDTDNYTWAEGSEETFDFTINPKPIPVVWGDDIEFTYDGQNHAPSVSIDPNRIEGSDQVDVTTAGEKTAGDHTATAVLTGTDKTNYVITDGTKTQDFTINAKKVTVTWARDAGSETDFDFTYNAEEQGPTCTIDANQIIKGETCTLTVSGQKKNVGNYVATASLSNDNYEILEEGSSASSHEFSISKKDVSFTWNPTYSGTAPDLENPQFIYNGEAQAPEATEVQGLIDGDDCAVTVSGQQITVGTDYEAIAELTGSSKDNYNLTTTPIQKYDIIANTVVTLKWSPASFVYNADFQCPEAEVTTSGKMEAGDCNLIYTVHKGTATGEVVTEGTKMPVGTYVVTAALEDTNNFVFGATNTEWEFTITQKEVEVALDIEDPMYYDADYHKPEITATGIYTEKDDCRPAVSLKGRTVDDINENILDCNDSTLPADKTGVIHASSGKYTAKVEALVGVDSANYKLKKNTVLKFTILPTEVTLDWFRPAYDEYGDEIVGADPVLVDVANGEKLMLVFNGKIQVPEAEIKDDMLLENAVTGEKDKCTVTVSAPSDAIEARTRAYKAVDISFSNHDYTRDPSGTNYYIIARPVKLKWDALEKTYNGKEQKRTVEITNIQKTDRGHDYSAGDGIGVVKVSEITYTLGHHFGVAGVDTDESKSTFDGETGYYEDDGTLETGIADGTEIAANRTPTDAGTYVMTAAALSDPYNYTLVRIDASQPEIKPAVITGTDQPAYVAYHHPIYKIHQFEIKKIDWRNTSVTYNASWQKPIAEVNKTNLQGPDKNSEVAVMIHEDKKSEKDNFVGKCNAKTYDIYVLKNEALRGIKGIRCMNYFIGDSAQKMQSKFTINKKPLTVTVYDKTGHYGDNPATYKYSVKYTGLVNGNVNKDDNHQNKNVPGKYNPNYPGSGANKDVVAGTLSYTTNYQKWGKPGAYYIKASGLTSDNYSIKYVDGKLTIKDRMLASDLVAKVSAGNNKAKISWRRVNGAAKYQVYFSLCNLGEKEYTPKLYKTVSAKKSSYTVKKLKRNTYYKYYVVALDSNGKRISRTEEHHFCTSNACFGQTNPKSVKASKKKITLKKGKTYKLSVDVTKVKSNLKLTNISHTEKVRFRSAAPKVATVNSKGTIKAVGSGWCRIYVMGANGIWQVVEVTVD